MINYTFYILSLLIIIYPLQYSIFQTFFVDVVLWEFFFYYIFLVEYVVFCFVFLFFFFFSFETKLLNFWKIFIITFYLFSKRFLSFLDDCVLLSIYEIGFLFIIIWNRVIYNFFWYWYFEKSRTLNQMLLNYYEKPFFYFFFFVFFF